MICALGLYIQKWVTFSGNHSTKMIIIMFDSLQSDSCYIVKKIFKTKKLSDHLNFFGFKPRTNMI